MSWKDWWGDRHIHTDTKHLLYRNRSCAWVYRGNCGLHVYSNITRINEVVPREIFDFRFFSWINFPQAPEYPIIPLFRKFAEIFAAQGEPPLSTTPDDKWKKSSIWKVLNILKFTLRCKQSDIVPIICHRCCWHLCCTLACEYLRGFFEKIRNDSNFRGFEEDNSWKNLKQKSRDTVPLNGTLWMYFYMKLMAVL